MTKRNKCHSEKRLQNVQSRVKRVVTTRVTCTFNLQLARIGLENRKQFLHRHSSYCLWPCSSSYPLQQGNRRLRGTVNFWCGWCRHEVSQSRQGLSHSWKSFHKDRYWYYWWRGGLVTPEDDLATVLEKSKRIGNGVFDGKSIAVTLFILPRVPRTNPALQAQFRNIQMYPLLTTPPNTSSIWSWRCAWVPRNHHYWHSRSSRDSWTLGFQRLFDPRNHQALCILDINDSLSQSRHYQQYANHDKIAIRMCLPISTSLFSACAGILSVLPLIQSFMTLALPKWQYSRTISKV